MTSILMDKQINRNKNRNAIKLCFAQLFVKVMYRLATNIFLTFSSISVSYCLAKHCQKGVIKVSIIEIIVHFEFEQNIKSRLDMKFKMKLMFWRHLMLGSEMIVLQKGSKVDFHGILLMV